MAIHDSQPYHQNIVEEIEYDDIEKIKVVGKGSFGTVYKGRWKNIFVAVKHIDNAAERKTFASEVRQMSRVSHPNIVKLYGASTKNPVCLIMEYAEGGSLYNVLHGRPAPKYNAGHAISWCLQCAKGVSYLHNLKPKAVIHRDLKPPNLLLRDEGRVLKICDFGTACDLKTYMTNNKGSAAWMAPEVFETSSYTEKCDVFSWGIILWQVLTREKPFNEAGGNALRIMWSVHKGKRPPLIENCPVILEKLMTRCWTKETENRPSMDTIVSVMSRIFPYFEGHDEPLDHGIEDSQGSDDDEMAEDGSYSDIPTSSIDSQQTISGSIGGTSAPTDSQFSVPLNIRIQTGKETWGNEAVIQLPDDVLELRHLSENNSSIIANMNGKTDAIDEDAGGAEPETQQDFDDRIYLMLDPQLRPLEPERTSAESVGTFEDHKKGAREYLRVQTELAYTMQRRQQLCENLSQCESNSSKTDEQEKARRWLESEKESLMNLRSSLLPQWEKMKKKKQTSNSTDWVVIPSE